MRTTIPLLTFSFVTGHRCERPSYPRLRLNQFQVIGTSQLVPHRPRHRPVMELLAHGESAEIDEIAGLHTPRPLTRAIHTSWGFGQIELDLFADPKGGLFAEPRAVL